MRSQVVSFHCVLRNQLGKVISSTYNRDVLTQVEGQPDLLKGLAKGLKGLRKGEKRRIFLAAQEAYGFYDPELVVECARKELKGGRSLSVGDEVKGEVGPGRPRTFRVIRADALTVTLDGNHPLAGQDLVFEIEATEARYATAEELQESRMDLPTGKPLLH